MIRDSLHSLGSIQPGKQANNHTTQAQNKQRCLVLSSHLLREGQIKNSESEIASGAVTVEIFLHIGKAERYL